MTIIAISLAWLNFFRIRKFTKRYKQFMQVGFDGKNLDQLIEACILKTHDAMDKSMEIQKTLNHIEANMQRSIQKVGIVRYSAFENVGGDQSFSVALLDTLDNGFVMSTLYTRENSNVYVKAVIGGQSKFSLTAEEIQAIDRAQKSFWKRSYTDPKPAAKAQ